MLPPGESAPLRSRRSNAARIAPFLLPLMIRFDIGQPVHRFHRRDVRLWSNRFRKVENTLFRVLRR
jgi:hypothetical protein